MTQPLAALDLTPHIQKSPPSGGGRASTRGAITGADWFYLSLLTAV
jgi:hypothetical protein